MRVPMAVVWETIVGVWVIGGLAVWLETTGRSTQAILVLIAGSIALGALIHRWRRVRQQR